LIEQAKAKVGGTGVIRDQFGNIKQEFGFSGETTLTEQDLRDKLNLNQEQKNGSHPYHNH
jgi:hypothetical protein